MGRFSQADLFALQEQGIDRDKVLAAMLARAKLAFGDDDAEIDKEKIGGMADKAISQAKENDGGTEAAVHLALQYMREMMIAKHPQWADRKFWEAGELPGQDMTALSAADAKPDTDVNPNDPEKKKKKEARPEDDPAAHNQPVPAPEPAKPVESRRFNQPALNEDDDPEGGGEEPPVDEPTEPTGEEPSNDVISCSLNECSNNDGNGVCIRASSMGDVDEAGVTPDSEDCEYYEPSDEPEGGDAPQGSDSGEPGSEPPTESDRKFHKENSQTPTHRVNEMNPARFWKEKKGSKKTIGESGGIGMLKTTFEGNHYHYVVVNQDGGGLTSMNAEHQHKITGGRIQEEKGHSHKIQGMPD